MNVMSSLANKKCTSPPLLAPRLKIFKLKFTTSAGIEPRPAEPEADMLPSEPARRAVHVGNITQILFVISSDKIELP